MREPKHDTTSETSQLLTSRISPSTIVYIPTWFVKIFRLTLFSLLENAFIKLPSPPGMIWSLVPHVEHPLPINLPENVFSPWSAFLKNVLPRTLRMGRHYWRCQDTISMLSGLSLDAFWTEFGCCFDAVWMLCCRSLEAIWMLSNT